MRQLSHAATKLLWSFLSIVAVVLSLVATAAPANASISVNGGLDPLEQPAQNVPANGSCGVNDTGTYVKFTTGGTSTSGGTANATGNGKSYTATYTSDQKTGLVQITSLTDGTNPVWFSGIVGSAQKNPVWAFPMTTAPSPVLQAPVDANFTSFAVCMYSTVSVQVKKVVVGTTTTQSFPVQYSCSYGTPPSVILAGTANLVAGASQTLFVPAGSTCSATDSAAGYDVTPAPDTQITQSGQVLTVTNTRRLGDLTVTKVQVGGDTQAWSFHADCVGPYEHVSPTVTVTPVLDPTTGKATGSQTISGLPIGLACTVVEDAANQNHFRTTASTSDPITVPGAITFTNTKDASIAVVKTENGAAPTHAFTFSLTGADGTTALRTTSPGNGTLDFGYVRPGTYRLCELAVDPGMTSSLASLAGATTNANRDVCVDVAAAAGQVISLGVNNTRDTGSIQISKTQVGGADQTWDFTISCKGGTFGETWSGTASVTGTGTTTVSGIPTGLACTVAEVQANRLPFDTTSANTTVTVPYTGQPAAPVVSFTNTKRADVTLTKTENGAAPRYVYTFTLTGNGVSGSVSTTPGVIQALDFGLLKPGTYQLCEQQVAAGTTPTLASWPGATTDPLTGTVCGTITLVAGVDQALTIDNHVGEGGRRTIGYWKNWATCTATQGKLDNAARTGKTLLDDVLKKGIVLGGYTVSTCQQGTTILANSAGKYAENALAAQLLAAKANVAVAPAPQAVLDAIAKGDALLTTIGYKGYPSAIVGSNHPLRADILAVAAYLDDFNNGRLG